MSASTSASLETPVDDEIGGGVEMGESVMAMIRPVILELDGQILKTRTSQTLLRHQIDALSQYLRSIANEQQAPYDLDMYVSKLDASRKRVTAVNSLLQSIHDRLSRLQRNIARQTYTTKNQLPGDVRRSSMDKMKNACDLL